MFPFDSLKSPVPSEVNHALMKYTADKNLDKLNIASGGKWTFTFALIFEIN